MPIRMLTLKAHTYGGQQLQPGDSFSARGRSDARLLAALGRAQIEEPVAQLLRPPAQQAQAAKPKAAAQPEPAAPALDPEPAFSYLPPAEEAPSAAEPAAEKPKRAYRRRDMVAEEGGSE